MIEDQIFTDFGLQARRQPGRHSRSHADLQKTEVIISVT